MSARWYEAPEYIGVWSVFDELAAYSEARRRSELRPHEDEETGKPDVLRLRERLDAALDALTQFEIRVQCGIAGVAPDATAEELLPSLSSMGKLVVCDSFHRYLNSYLYFGVRILLRRCFLPAQVRFDDGGHEVNRLPWWLEIPPALVGEDADIARVHPGRTDTADERAALRYLDGTPPAELDSLRADRNVQETLELWIRGLRPDLQGPAGTALESIASGFASWARRQAAFYLYLAGHASTPLDPLPLRPKGGWDCNTPVVARVALGDLYWLASLLRSDVTGEARVVSKAASWLGLLRFRAGDRGDLDAQRTLQGAEEILRQVFGICCDLVQNASDLAALTQLRAAEKAHGHDESARLVAGQAVPPLGWQAVFDAELDEIEQQRKLRDYGERVGPSHMKAAFVPANLGWSKRLLHRSAVPDLIGIALSGGGIRSATFNLGVLQGLQELDVLRQVDYVSSVSGGGFAGAWLLANVKRSNYWLGRLTAWDRSIRHLREYSNYLAPRTGVLSMDTWSLGALWLRNTLLVQLNALAWLLVLFTAVYLERLLFDWVALKPKAGAACLAVMAAIVVVELGANLLPRKHLLGRFWAVLLCGLLPAWVGANLLATRIVTIAQAHAEQGLADQVRRYGPLTEAAAIHLQQGQRYSALLLQVLPASHFWQVLLLSSFAGVFALSALSLCYSATRRSGAAGPPLRIAGALGIAAVCTAVLHLCLTAIVWAVFLLPMSLLGDQRVPILLFTFLPAIVLSAYAIAILLMIGLAGNASDDGQREWWTRYGAWVLACAAVGLVLPALVFGAPWLVHWFADLHSKHRGLIKWGAVASWVGTSVGGLLAGRSSRTTGEGATRSPSLQMLANVGGTVFLVGAAIGAAELLFLFLRSYNSPHVGLGVLGFEAAAGRGVLLSTLAVLLFCSLLFSRRFDLNVFGLSELYRNRLVRCYLGATRWQPGDRVPQPFTRFDFQDDIKLSELAGEGCRGPFPILNCSMNLSGSADLALHTRHSASFTLTPLHCGAYRRFVGYRETASFAGGIQLGQAVAVSGAAASPNMGYNTAPLVALLLTLFNVRLGWWFPNPGRTQTASRGPRGLRYLLTELLGQASERRDFVNVTDGGHFENLGIYELVRRRSQLIIACDAECDETMTFTGLANAIRLCATDFGAVIDLDLSSVRRRDNGLSGAHSAVGVIRYSDGSVGRIIYLKASLTGDEDATVLQYHSGHLTFPHETTANQFFKEEQFESYRRLGQHIVRNALRSATAREPLIHIAERLIDTMTPAANSSEKFLRHTQALEQMWQHFREHHPQQLKRNGFLLELMGEAKPDDLDVDADITCIGLELLQLMEDIFIDLQLDDFWEHPDHRGWAMLFMSWARSPRFRAVWQANHHTFGIRFEHFCASRLGLAKDNPVLRVSPLTRD